MIKTFIGAVYVRARYLGLISIGGFVMVRAKGLLGRGIQRGMLSETVSCVTPPGSLSTWRPTSEFSDLGGQKLMSTSTLCGTGASQHALACVPRVGWQLCEQRRSTAIRVHNVLISDSSVVPGSPPLYKHARFDSGHYEVRRTIATPTSSCSASSLWKRNEGLILPGMSWGTFPPPTELMRRG